jgi:hypothetical protein
MSHNSRRSCGQRTVKLDIYKPGASRTFVKFFEQSNCAVRTNLGQSQTDAGFGVGDMVKYKIGSSVYSVYKRITPVPSGTSIYQLMTNTWSIRSGNRFNTDFKLYSSVADAEANRNPWRSCNGDDPGVGFPRDCGPHGLVGGRWMSHNSRRSCGQRTVSLEMKKGGGPSGTVTCRFTMDNYVDAVYFGGSRVSVSGNLNSWPSVKAFSFPDRSGVLAIKGRNAEGRGCQTGGLSLTCTSTNSRSPWNGFKSSTSTMEAYGSTRGNDPSGWKQSVVGSTPCQTTSGFSQSGFVGSGRSPYKIWAANGHNYAWFSGNAYSHREETELPAVASEEVSDDVSDDVSDVSDEEQVQEDDKKQPEADTPASEDAFVEDDVEELA